jgi:hypothetical protein
LRKREEIVMKTALMHQFGQLFEQVVGDQDGKRWDEFLEKVDEANREDKHSIEKEAFKELCNEYGVYDEVANKIIVQHGGHKGKDFEQTQVLTMGPSLDNTGTLMSTRRLSVAEAQK